MEARERKREIERGGGEREIDRDGRERGVEQFIV